MKVVILAGGSGTRLWPMSREYFPKQFIKLKQLGESLFQKTFERSLNLAKPDDVLIVTNEKHKFLVLMQIEELGINFNENNVLIEPNGKNTLPAIYYAVKSAGNNEDVLVLPSDHLIGNEEIFVDTVNKSKGLAKNNLVTYGIVPKTPHTGYGYIMPGESFEIGNKALEFKEKPDEKTAKEYIKKGYLWNSGMFLFNSDLFVEEVKKYSNDIYTAFESEDIDEIYENVLDISIDYGLMEKSKNVAVVPLNVSWSDLGSFDAIYDEFEKDESGNIIEKSNIAINSKNNLVYSPTGKMVALSDIDDCIVVDTKDALMICKKGSSQSVKNIVSKLKSMEDERTQFHQTVYRPWGSYTVLEEGFFYKIKRITVNPKKRLSSQLHHHRSEHWVVVKGMAKVTVENEEYFVSNGESTFVNGGFKHRLENPGMVPLEVIEIQIGEYLEEDDIIRFDDEWGRK
ncbi:mannose-6-phosphate isomerase, type 2 / mannose-1-phosphate guanylyltransferase (GDP) [Methanococcus maripaludis C5]|uniref:mannose-1-phosphate guanylyltransferase n=1 Tax=Methanococcus maripaludis (strain C5 / ATCC BAA-1333) TaxID=402880 RepID=A4FZG3_METM5|nr:mannose-1-phosphate guanylyltransferase/mannose-6-phosphate isomerase [Methanococcus maripaludis]ABO35597.1 mannose-6-phosphate isomerase, type 2 / mannose-1-phosphate guanylyltransferase (GDP) [Methanococcus maripaludis C5]